VWRFCRRRGEAPEPAQQGFERGVLFEIVIGEAKRRGRAHIASTAEAWPARRCAICDHEAGAALPLYHNFKSTPALDPCCAGSGASPPTPTNPTTARKPSIICAWSNSARAARWNSADRLRYVRNRLGHSAFLLPRSACLYTYAAPFGDAGTGSWTDSGTRHAFALSLGETHTPSRVYGVIACPVAHFEIALIHNRAFHARRLDAVYLPFLVSPPSSPIG